MSDKIVLDDEHDDQPKDLKKSDLMAVSGNLITSINYKLGLFMFVLGVLVFSDVFIEKILGRMGGMVDGEITTTKGATVQLVIFILLMLFIDVMIQWGWL